jgi:hypothetical protein
VHENFDGAWRTRCAPNEAPALELQNHLVYRGWRDSKKRLHISLSGRSSIESCVGVDEGEVLALLLCVCCIQGIAISLKA